MIVPVYVHLEFFEAAEDPLDLIAGLIYVAAFANQSLLCHLVLLVLHHVLIVELAYRTEVSLRVHY